jgi:peptide/nickel transport system permease protein
MLAYAVRRLIATIPTVLIVALIIFSLLYFSPGDPAAILAGDMATPDDIARIRQQLALDQSYLIRFGDWIWAVLHGDLGTSIFTNLPVSTLILQRLEPTVALTICTMVVVVIVAVPLGVIAAWRVGRPVDRAVMGFAVLGFSVPIFVVAYVFIYVFSVQLKLLPVQGYVSLSEGVGPFLSHMVLPSVALGMTLMALIARITRASMLEVLSQDYVRTARAKGLGEGPVLIRHALKNAAVPIVTIIGIGVAMIIGGVVITETVFAIPGVGRLTVDAILRRDYPVSQGIILVFSIAYVLINLLVDLSYCLFDPRIRY